MGRHAHHRTDSKKKKPYQDKWLVRLSDEMNQACDAFCVDRKLPLYYKKDSEEADNKDNIRKKFDL